MDTDQPIIEAHLRRHARRYSRGSAEDGTVVLLRAHTRAAARIYWYRVGARVVVVKIPGPAADLAPRPRLTDLPCAATRYAQEHEALSRLERHFSRHHDPRFGAVPLLDRIDAARAIVTGAVDGQPMTQLLRRLTRMHGGVPPEVRTAVENAGAWLREYHQLDPLAARHTLTTREQFVTAAARFCTHLGATLGQPALFGALAVQMEAAARRLFPPELPLGLGHGDFAMRNVLVGAGSRVVVLDTLALWVTPVYADLAKFMLAMRLSRPQMYSGGLAFSDSRLQQIDRWFLAGYYGTDAAPDRQIALYALLLLLDKWSFELAVRSSAWRVVETMHRGYQNAWFAAQARAMARQVA